MIRAVIDTNVFVSALINPRGAPGQILEMFLADAFVLIVSPATIDELRLTLCRPRIHKYIGLGEEEIERLIAQVESIADVVKATHEIKVELRDPDDSIFLAAAVEGRAAFVVSGDDDLLSIQSYQEIMIIKPRAFLDRLRK